MPSPFPGMDPFLESQHWPDFHAEFITAFRAILAPRVRPRYYVVIEKRVYVEHDPDDPIMVVRPDVSIMESDRWEPRDGTAVATAITTAPVECLMPQPERVYQTFLTVRRQDVRTIVTIVELLSPSNKRPGSDGYDEYQEKRKSVMESNTNLVELDLLRGGRRMPVMGDVPRGDYRAIVARYLRRPTASVYAWKLEDRLPTLPIPLTEPDEEVALDLQEVFDTAYDRAGYADSLDYNASVQPPLESDRAGWVAQCLSRRSCAR